jgi:putative transcriptional regulator
MTEIKAGSILISEPYLGDPNFERTVVLICRHDLEGSFGLVLNRRSNLKLGDVLDYIEHDFEMELGIGGPLQHNTLHYIHNRADFPAAIKLAETLYWGGDYEYLKSKLEAGEIDPEEIRFFLGYSGWTPGQLEEEIDKNVWILNNKASKKLFTLNIDTLWRQILKDMGGKYKVLSNYPVDPSLN